MRSFPLFLLGLIVGASSNLQAHRGERTYLLREITEEMAAEIDLDDGSVDEWISFGPPTATLLDFSIAWYSNISSYDQSDLDLSIWLAWTRTPPRIYVALVRADDAYVNEYSEPDTDSMALHDALDIRFDADHSGGETQRFGVTDLEERKLLGNSNAQWFWALPTVPIGPNVKLVSRLAYAAWPSAPPFADGGGGVAGEDPTITVTEFYVTIFDRYVYTSPEESREAELWPGKVIGLYMRVLDRDSGPEDEHASYLAPDTGLGSPFDADNWADGLLVGAEIEESRDSAVGSKSWGRIKASLGQ